MTARICRRTRQVWEAVLRHSGVAECWDVTDQDLKSLEWLRLERSGVTSLKADDLAGMSNLRYFRAEDNRLTKVAIVETGAVSEYRNEPGMPAAAVTDAAAFHDACRAG